MSRSGRCIVTGESAGMPNGSILSFRIVSRRSRKIIAPEIVSKREEDLPEHNAVGERLQPVGEAFRHRKSAADIPGVVMPWLDHGIHSVTVDDRDSCRLAANRRGNGMDCRVKPGNDDKIEALTPAHSSRFAAAALRRKRA